MVDEPVRNRIIEPTGDTLRALPPLTARAQPEAVPPVIATGSRNATFDNLTNSVHWIIEVTREDSWAHLHTGVRDARDTDAGVEEGSLSYRALRHFFDAKGRRRKPIMDARGLIADFGPAAGEPDPATLEQRLRAAVRAMDAKLKASTEDLDPDIRTILAGHDRKPLPELLMAFARWPLGHGAQPGVLDCDPEHPAHKKNVVHNLIHKLL